MSIPRERPVVLKDLYSILARAIRVVVKDSPMGDTRTLFESTDNGHSDDEESDCTQGMARHRDLLVDAARRSGVG
jgi:hypothetical protein